MSGTSWRDIARLHAIRAALATMRKSGLSHTGLDDAANRALPHFILDDSGQLVTATGESISDWVDNLKQSAPHLFDEAPAARPNLGRVGDGRANHRLDWANQQGSKQ